MASEHGFGSMPCTTKGSIMATCSLEVEVAERYNLVYNFAGKNAVFGMLDTSDW